jgi:hypothetical protein
MAEIGKACPGDQTDIARTDHRDAHAEPFVVAMENEVLLKDVVAALAWPGGKRKAMQCKTCWRPIRVIAC